MDDILLVAYDEVAKTYDYSAFMCSFRDFHIAKDVASVALSYGSISCLVWLTDARPRYIIKLDEFGVPHCQRFK